jgi:hypothetical protein
MIEALVLFKFTQGSLDFYINSRCSNENYTELIQNIISEYGVEQLEEYMATSTKLVSVASLEDDAWLCHAL